MKTAPEKNEVLSKNVTNVPTSKDNIFSAPPDNLQQLFLEKKVIHFLRTLPYLEFTATGINNIVKRFGVTPEHLFILIDFVRKGGGCNG